NIYHTCDCGGVCTHCFEFGTCCGYYQAICCYGIHCNPAFIAFFIYHRSLVVFTFWKTGKNYQQNIVRKDHHSIRKRITSFYKLGGKYFEMVSCAQEDNTGGSICSAG